MEVTYEVVLTSSLFEWSQRLFSTYPLAISEASVKDNGTIQSMVLMLQDADKVNYIVLSQSSCEDRSWYSLCPWPDGPALTIEAGGDVLVPENFASAVNRASPLPRDGSLFGWICDDIVTSLIAFYTEFSPAVPEPCWSVMPRVGIPDTQWPPFTGEPLIGEQFWIFKRARKIISVEGLIAETSGTVFWVDTEAEFGSGCCVVVSDARNAEGYTLPSGRYVYHKVPPATVPSLPALLAKTNKTDLAPRFRLYSTA